MTEIESTLADMNRLIAKIETDDPHREFRIAMVVNLLSPRLAEAVRKATA